MFSVVIPLYNKESTIRRTIESVLNQTYQDFEILVVNDGSTDDSAEIVESVKDPRINVIHQVNQGVSVARNVGIKKAKYNWLALLDGDDRWDARYLGMISSAIKDNPDCIAYCTGYRRISDQGELPRASWKYVPEKRGTINNYFKSSFFSSPVITSSSVCLNRRMLKLIDVERPFPVGAKSGEDLDTWVRLALVGNVYFINDILVTIDVMQTDLPKLADRLGGEFDYREWCKYSGKSSSEVFWLRLYALKKIYMLYKKYIRAKVPVLYNVYEKLR